MNNIFLCQHFTKRIQSSADGTSRLVTSSLTCLWAFSCASIGAHWPVHLWQRLTSSQIYKHILALKEFVCSGRRLSSLNFSSTVYCLPTSSQPSRRWVLWKWKYSKEHRQYHRQEMDLELLKGHWNNWAGIDHCPIFGQIVLGVWKLSQPYDDGISLSEKWNIINQRALAAEKRSSIKVMLTSICIYCVYYYLDNFAWIL